MAVVRLSTELPIPADTAFALAQKTELFRYVVAPVMRAPGITVPDEIGPGAEASGRLWFFGVIPGWRHHLRLVRIGDGELYTNEHGGPLRTWNHRLTFVPLDEERCRYTDEVEVDDGLLGAGTALFVRVFFRWRHRRWRQLARVLA